MKADQEVLELKTILKRIAQACGQVPADDAAESLEDAKRSAGQVAR